MNMKKGKIPITLLRRLLWRDEYFHEVEGFSRGKETQKKCSNFRKQNAKKTFTSMNF